MTAFNQKTHDTDVGSYGGQSRQMMLMFVVVPAMKSSPFY